MKNYIIKNASIQDINLILEWARLEGWNPGLHDAVPFHITDPAGFLIGYLDHIPIASISVVRYLNHFGFLGLYIVTPKYRGQGYGFSLWQKGLNYLKDYNVGLDGVIAQQDNYLKSGFKLAYRNIRYTGYLKDASTTAQLINARLLPFNLLQQYDQRFFPSQRAAFLAAWFSMPTSQTLAVIEKKMIMGLGSIRKCHKSYKIGPLFAENFEIAKQLLLGLAKTANQQTIFIDVPEVNREAIKLAQQFNLTPVFETARMYTRSFPAINLTKIFGITTFELG